MTPNGTVSVAADSGTSRTAWTWWLVCGLLACLAGVAVAASHANSDAAWYLYMAERVLGGSRMYVDIADTNPPLIVWLTCPPALLWRAGVPGAVALNGYVLVLALLAVGATGALSARAWGGRWPASALGLVAVGVAFVALPYVRADFGQREHLMVLAALPYLFAAMAWLRGRRLGVAAAWAVGVIGGLGFVIKPYYLAGWAAVELVLAIEGRGRASWRRAEMVAAVCAMVVYGLAVLLLTPQYLHFARVVHAVYGGLDSPWRYLLALSEVRVWLLCLVALVAIRLPADSRRACTVLFAAQTGFLFAALVQMKGWTYHLYPSRALAVLFLLVLGLSVLDALPALVSAVRGGMRMVAFGGALVFVGLGVQFAREARGPHADLVTPLVQLVSREAPGGRLAQLSMRTIIWPAFPAVVEQRLGWSLRQNALWFLPGLYEQELAPGRHAAVVPRSPEAMGSLERSFFDEIVSDLCTAPPDLLLVESPVQPGAGRTLDLQEYYGQDPRYRALLRSYAALAPLDQFAVFKRLAPAACR